MVNKWYGKSKWFSSCINKQKKISRTLFCPASVNAVVQPICFLLNSTGSLFFVYFENTVISLVPLGSQSISLELRVSTTLLHTYYL